MASYTFKAAPWSRSVWLITIACLAALLGGSAILISITPSALGGTLGVGGLLAIILLMAALSPRAYVVDQERITVSRLVGRIQVDLGNIHEVTIMDGRQAFRGSRRSIASGGAFGYYGQFYSHDLETFTAYVTSLDRVVVIRQRKGGPVVVSPDRPEEFVSCIEDLLKSLPAGPGPQPQAAEN